MLAAGDLVAGGAGQGVGVGGGRVQRGQLAADRQYGVSVLGGGMLAHPGLQLLDLLPALRRGLLGLLADSFLRLRLRDRPVQHPEQPSDVKMEVARAQLKGLSAYQLGQARWQLVGTGHLGPFNQNGDDADMPCQSCLDLQPHEVGGIIEEFMRDELVFVMAAAIRSLAMSTLNLFNGCGRVVIDLVKTPICHGRYWMRHGM